MNGLLRWLLAAGIIWFALATVASLAHSAPTLTLAWDAPVEPVAKYRVYRATAPAGPYSLLKTTTALSTRVEVPVGESRCYRIRAVDDLGQASPDSARLCASVMVEVTE